MAFVCVALEAAMVVRALAADVALRAAQAGGLVVLDGVTYASNIASVARNAACFGVGALLLLPPSSSHAPFERAFRRLSWQQPLSRRLFACE